MDVGSEAVPTESLLTEEQKKVRCGAFNICVCMSI